MMETDNEDMTETETDDEKTPAPRTDPVVETILAVLNELAPDGSASPMDVARAYAARRAKPSDPPDVWRRYMNAVKQQMVHLARDGQIEITRKGQPVDPNNFKGVVRLRLPAQA
jgi:hypothetical protein